MTRMAPVRCALVAAALALPGAASAQWSDQWQFGATLYGYLPTISGQSNFPAGSTPGVSVDVDRILDDLKFVFMGSFQARKGRWGFFTDVVYIDVGDDRSGSRDLVIGGIGIPASAEASVRYDLKGLVWTIAGEYGVHATREASLDVFAGARLVDVEGDIRWNLSGDIGSIPVSGRSGSSNAGRSQWDGIVGVKGRLRFGEDRRWFVPYYLDVGAGESDLTWQAQAGLGYSWGWGDVVLAWRYLDYDLGSGKAFRDLTLNGPELGVVLRW